MYGAEVGRLPRRWRWLPLLAVVALALLAGCGGFATDGAGGPTPTLTPAAVPGEDLPVGEGPGGVYLKVDHVVDAHRGTLSNDSHTLVETLRVGPRENATYVQRTEIAVGAGDVPVAVDRDRSVDHRGYVGRGTDAWWNGQRTYYRYAFEVGQYTYQVGEDPPPRQLHIEGRFEEVLAALDVAEIRYRRDGSIHVAGSIDESGAVPRNRFVSSVQNATMSLQLRSDGTVGRMAIGYNASYFDRGVQRVRYTYRVTEVGTTDPSEPAWLEEFDGTESDD